MFNNIKNILNNEEISIQNKIKKLKYFRNYPPLQLNKKKLNKYYESINSLIVELENPIYDFFDKKLFNRIPTQKTIFKQLSKGNYEEIFMNEFKSNNLPLLTRGIKTCIGLGFSIDDINYMAHLTPFNYSNINDRLIKEIEDVLSENKLKIKKIYILFDVIQYKATLVFEMLNRLGLINKVILVTIIEPRKYEHYDILAGIDNNIPICSYNPAEEVSRSLLKVTSENNGDGKYINQDLKLKLNALFLNNGTLIPKQFENKTVKEIKNRRKIITSREGKYSLFRVTNENNGNGKYIHEKPLLKGFYLNNGTHIPKQFENKHVKEIKNRRKIITSREGKYSLFRVTNENNGNGKYIHEDSWKVGLNGFFYLNNGTFIPKELKNKPVKEIKNRRKIITSPNGKYSLFRVTNENNENGKYRHENSWKAWSNGFFYLNNGTFIPKELKNKPVKEIKQLLKK